MQKIIFITNYRELAEDMEADFQLNAQNYDYELTCYSTIENIDEIVANRKPDLVVLSVPFLKKRDSWEFRGTNTQVAFHAISKTQLEEGANYDYPTIGVTPTFEEAMEKLKEKPYYVKRKEKQDQKNQSKPQKKQSEAAPPQQVKKKTDQKLNESKNKIKPESRKKTSLPGGYASGSMSVLDEDEYYIDGLDDDLDIMSESVINEDEPELEDYTELTDDLEPEDDLEIETEEVPEPRRNTTALKATQESKSKNIQKKEPASKPKKEAQKKEIDYIEREFMKDTKHDKIKTKVVTVYAAKGGVGKTTISTELAVYLSLVSKGRNNLRVCLVDYNIDFGDVKATLNLNSKNANLTMWAEEVQDRLDRGEAPEDINFTRKEMEEEYLTLYKRSGLYVLPTSSAHEDSMGISSDALEVILRNIINNAGFDFVICDTGNNTRDSAMIALEHADITLIVMTQSVNTANCDKAFMSTMEQIDFALSSPKLVVNYIMPQKVTNISVQEILDFFPYDCVGKIKFNSDVIKASNLAEPLAFQPDHEFTKQLRSIVTYLLKDSEFEVRTKSKKKLFGFIPIRNKD